MLLSHNKRLAVKLLSSLSCALQPMNLTPNTLTGVDDPVKGDYTSESTLTTGEIHPLAFQDVVVSVQWLLEG